MNPRWMFPVLAAFLIPRSALPQAAAPSPGATKVNPKDGLTYVWIPSGSFIMGCSPDDSACLASEKPAHQVRLTHGFWIGQTDVTQAAYQKVTGNNPGNPKNPRLPANRVTWNEAQAYCQAVGARLPTEAEWEYAARGGNNSKTYGNPLEVSWNFFIGDLKPHEVATKKPNAFGLYDTLGNVQQWVGDYFDPRYFETSERQDPFGPRQGEKRTVRGNGYYQPPDGIRVSARSGSDPEQRQDSIGFRCSEGPGDIPVPDAKTLAVKAQKEKLKKQLQEQGWMVREDTDDIALQLGGPIPAASIPLLRQLPVPYRVMLIGPSVTEISPLRDVANLTWLVLEKTEVSDLSVLRTLPALETLDVSAGPKLRDLSPLSNLNHLSYLKLYETGVTDISPLAGLSNMATLNLAGTPVSDISPLRRLFKLTSLDLRQTRVSDLSALRDLSEMTYLSLDDLPVTSISPLQNMRKLKILGLTGTKVADLSPLRDLHSLTFIGIDRTPVTDLTPLHGLVNLQELDIRFTRITNLSPLQGLKNLKVDK